MPKPTITLLKPTSNCGGNARHRRHYGRAYRICEGHGGGVISVAFSPDGKTLASASGKTVRMWDVAIRHPLGEPLIGHSESVVSVAFSPDGKTLASVSWDLAMLRWDMDPESWVTRKPTLPDEIELGERNSDWRISRHRLSDIHDFITCTVIPRFEPFNLADVPAESLRVYKIIDSEAR